MVRHIMSILFLCSFASCFHNARNQNYDFSKVTLDADTQAVLVFGGGVAGLTAANYLAQANIPCTLLEGAKPGGALAQSHSVRNWPGVIDATGQDIIKTLKDQVIANGVEVAPARVTSVDFSSWPYVVEVRDLVSGAWKKIRALSCIIATGAEPNYLGIPGEKEFWGKGVTNCAVCDGALFKDKNVAVVGGGDSAVLEALYLSRIAQSVNVFLRADHFIAKDKRKLDEVQKLANARVHFKTQVQEVVGSRGKVTELKLAGAGVPASMPIDGLFLAIGAKPNTKLFTGQMSLDSAGYIQLKHDQQTSLPGVFAAGDVCDPVYKQAVTSAADGCRAALQAEAFLNAANFNMQKFEQQVESAAQSSATVNVEKTPAHLVEMTGKQQLAKLIATHDNVLIDVSTPLCLSCKAMEPVVSMMLARFGEKVTFVHADLSKEAVDAPDISRLVDGAEIASAPTFIFVKKGKEVHRFEDEKNAEEFAQLIQKHF